jgi:hypothetical protein
MSIMAITTREYVDRIRGGYYSRGQLETLKNNALRKGVDEIIEACKEALSYGTGKSQLSTREIGLGEAERKLRELGAGCVERVVERGKSLLKVVSPSGKVSRVNIRSKSSGTWQASIKFAKELREPEKGEENEYWLFVDLEISPPAFYIMPSWWILNDIHHTHQEYIRKNGGKRVNTPDSEHHSVAENRIVQWKSKWELIEISETEKGNRIRIAS